jgi:hypothetical protein
MDTTYLFRYFSAYQLLNGYYLSGSNRKLSGVFPWIMHVQKNAPVATVMSVQRIQTMTCMHQTRGRTVLAGTTGER